ncbi:MAG TPA: hypothetical protein VM328_03700 [Fimbriimonadaceae bacterium]|nr:hypothetical protein [Fimbriimonadaceae bacterium]
MSALARWLSRRLWFWMLWIMRRNWMKRLQNATYRLLGSRWSARARRSVVAQNRWARRYGLGLMTLSMNLFLASLFISLSYALTLELYSAGALTVPSDRAH